MKHILLSLLLVLILVSCGGAQRASTTAAIPLGQARAVELLEETVASREEYGPVSQNLSATLNNGTEVNIDVMVDMVRAGFVWLNEQDRRNLQGEIPGAADESQIYALVAEIESSDQPVHVMIIQDTDFQYIPNPRANERIPADRTIADVEARLRRDALDFLHAIFDLHGGTPE